MPYDPISGPMSANRKPNHHSCGNLWEGGYLGPSSLQAPFDEHRVQEATDRQCPSSSATSRHLQAKGQNSSAASWSAVQLTVSRGRRMRQLPQISRFETDPIKIQNPAKPTHTH